MAEPVGVWVGVAAVGKPQFFSFQTHISENFKKTGTNQHFHPPEADIGHPGRRRVCDGGILSFISSPKNSLSATLAEPPLRHHPPTPWECPVVSVHMDSRECPFLS